MKYTFGIITNNQVNNNIIESIVMQNIENFEIIIVGGNNVYNKYIKHIPFDESLKNMWITRKKNIITENAKYENIVYMHDYYKLDINWYLYQSKVNDFDVCMNRILNQDGSRFRDWCVWDDPEMCFVNGRHGIKLPDYTYNKTNYMYISGGYWIN
jgi:hypothetical protein